MRITKCAIYLTILLVVSFAFFASCSKDKGDTAMKQGTSSETFIIKKYDKDRVIILGQYKNRAEILSTSDDRYFFPLSEGMESSTFNNNKGSLFIFGTQSKAKGIKKASLWVGNGDNLFSSMPVDAVSNDKKSEVLYGGLYFVVGYDEAAPDAYYWKIWNANSMKIKSSFPKSTFDKIAGMVEEDDYIYIFGNKPGGGARYYRVSANNADDHQAKDIPAMGEIHAIDDRSGITLYGNSTSGNATLYSFDKKKVIYTQTDYQSLGRMHLIGNQTSNQIYYLTNKKDSPNTEEVFFIEYRHSDLFYGKTTPVFQTTSLHIDDIVYNMNNEKLYYLSKNALYEATSSKPVKKALPGETYQRLLVIKINE